jgi:hypothetical protein
MNLKLSPQDAWAPLPPSAWDGDAACHLMRRVGWTARPEDVQRALAEGLPATLDRLFPQTPPVFVKPGSITRLEEIAPDLLRRAREAAPGEERQRLQRELRERSQSALLDLSVKWLQFAVQPEHSAFAKWNLFLGDVYVVSQEKVRQSNLIYEHQEILFRHGLGRAPDLTKAVSRSPAMIVYLDLQQSQRNAPNENFARELFELFTLGEGNYTEADIKEAARAFTGYRQLMGRAQVLPRQADTGAKTIFGRKGRFDGDAVIDLAYEQPAAATFLPQELARFYLAESALPKEHLAALGAGWRASGFDLRRLARTFFGSRLFFNASYRGNYIKSPVQFYLGMLQDLDLHVAPVPRLVVNALRQMGQTLYQPPNVRGWVGGRLWINSSTLAARRQLVQALFSPFNDANLNADELVEIAAARAEGRARFVVGSDSLRDYASLEPARAADRFIDYLLPVKPDSSVRDALRDFLSSEVDAASRRARLERVRNAAVTLLQSPEYQLC